MKLFRSNKWLVLFLCFLGISQISTNYTITQNLPRGEKVSSDFLYFEETIHSKHFIKILHISVFFCY